MKLIAETRGYTKPRIKITVSHNAVKLKYPYFVEGEFKDRLLAFALYVGTECRKTTTRTMRGQVGKEESGKLSCALMADVAGAPMVIVREE